MFKINNKKEFTAVEMLVVVSIIVLLSTLGTWAYVKARQGVMIKGVKMDLFSLKKAIESYSLSRKGMDVEANPENKKVTFYKLMKTGLYDSVHWKPGKNLDKSADLLDAFGGKIEVKACKLSKGAGLQDIEANLSNIGTHKYLTPEFQFFYGNHPKIAPGSNDYGKPGVDVSTGGNALIYYYHYRLIFLPDPENTDKEFFVDFYVY